MTVQECVVCGCTCWYTLKFHPIRWQPLLVFMYSGWQFHVFIHSDIRSSSIIFACSNVLIVAFKIVSVWICEKKLNSEMNARITFTYVFVFHLNTSKRPSWTRGLKCAFNKFSYRVIYWRLSYMGTDYVLRFSCA